MVPMIVVGEKAERVSAPGPVPPRGSAAAIAIVVAIVLVAVACARSVVPVSDLADRALATLQPVVRPHLTGRVLDGTPTAAARQLLVNAHNAGDRAGTARSALAARPGMVEIDVRLVGTRLRALHDRPWDEARGAQLGMSLAAAWSDVHAAPATLLDLKSNSDAATGRLETFLMQHEDGRTVYVSTPVERALVGLRVPPAAHVVRLLSVTDEAQLDRVLGNPLPADIRGVSIRRALVTSQVVRALRHRNLLVQVYSVNRMSDVDRLARWGVTGITTDDLNVMRALARPVSVVRL